MIKNYIKIAWRNIWRNKLHSSINVFGLAIAFAISSILFVTAYFQLSFDSFHKESGSLFKVSKFSMTEDGGQFSSQFPLPFLDAVKADIPQVQKAARVIYGRDEPLSTENKKINRIVTRVDADFLQIFNFKIIDGDAQNALPGIENIALTRGTAIALFGTENAIGKELNLGESNGLIVSAILEDCPKNSSIQFQALARIETFPSYQENQNNWSSGVGNVFVKIAESSNPAALDGSFDAFVSKYYADELAELNLGKSDIPEGIKPINLKLTNIESIHFSGERSTPLFLIYTLIILGVFILLIACINFISLNLANSFTRAREIGVRKSLGAFKGQVFFQFWSEALVIYFIGFVLGIFLTYQLLPIFNARTDANVGVNTLIQPQFLGRMSLIFLVVTLIAGGYPALRISGSNIIDVLKGKLSNGKPSRVRNTLLVSQFAISTFLICLSFIGSKQLHFLQTKPIGFDKEQVLSIPVSPDQDGQLVLKRLKNALVSNPEVLSISGTGINLGRGLDLITMRSTSSWDYLDKNINMDWILTETDFLRTMNIPLVAGRDFNENSISDRETGLIVSESFVKAMGETEAVGKFIGENSEGKPYQILGVVSDFHFFSPSEEVLPIAMHLSDVESVQYLFLKLKSENLIASVQKIENTWNEATNKAEFKASFVNENLEAWYEGERLMTDLFSSASSIAIFLSCLGLFALSLLTIQLRTKEVGIRKVMGASVSDIVKIISFYFIKLVLIGLIVALPLAWFASNAWLENYEYRISQNPFIFLAVALLVTLIALATVSFHTIKAALMNPVNSLKSE
ncbi:FtsX-like permease family protein [uncultured Arcticibacterium sp.]|uniref:ABC transporter permease n=1 Tax=uncultured Arcticibacterium sp. TaxID=2173042 RepID=UPI0030F7FEBF